MSVIFVLVFVLVALFYKNTADTRWISAKSAIPSKLVAITNTSISDADIPPATPDQNVSLPPSKDINVNLEIIPDVAATIIDDTNDKISVIATDNSLKKENRGIPRTAWPEGKSIVLTHPKVSTKLASAQDKSNSALAVKAVAPRKESTNLFAADNIVNNEITLHSNQKQSGNNIATDSDITLLSALVAHENTIQKQLKEIKIKNDTPSRISKKQKKPEANLDIIERKKGHSLKSLLLRCSKLGGLEARLCRKRICKGRATAESACFAM
ncbi:hypothetical protein BH11PSE12_BH11PSE12_23020 [soil metagenome]